MHETNGNIFRTMLFLFFVVIIAGIYKLSILIDGSNGNYKRIEWFAGLISLVIGTIVGLLLIISIALVLWSVFEKNHNVEGWKHFFQLNEMAFMLLIISELLKTFYCILLLSDEIHGQTFQTSQDMLSFMHRTTWFRLNFITDFVFLLGALLIFAFNLIKLLHLSKRKSLACYMLCVTLAFLARFFV